MDATMETPQPSLGRLIALLIIGAGLVVTGVALYLWYDPPSPLDLIYSSGGEEESPRGPAEVNYAAPELMSLTDLDGNPVSLEDYRGSVALVNLWATWCPPCRAEMPALDAFYQKYKRDGFVLLAIDQGEDRATIAPFIAEKGLTFPVWLDSTSEAGSKFDTDALPSSYVLDRDGRVRLVWIGGISEEELETYVPKIIYENQE
jgi:thiol-disulfide isomerase/thioredoxin